MKIEKTSEDKFDSHKKNRNGQSAYYGMPSEASRQLLWLQNNTASSTQFFHT